MKALLVVVLLLAAAGCSRSEDQSAQEDTLVAPVKASTVSSHHFTQTVEGTGIISALPESVRLITPLYAGRVARLLVHVGSTVAAGDPLCVITLDPVAVAEIEKLRRNLTLAERTRDRQQHAVDAGVSPRIALEQAAMDAANARAELDARTRDYDVAAKSLTLHAPAAGLVTAVGTEVGQQVDAATQAITLVDPTQLAAKVLFDAAAAARVAEGQRGSLVPLDGSASPIPATVFRIAHALDPASQRSETWLRAPDARLVPGTYVGATVEIGAADNLAVPRPALVKTDRGYRVFVLSDGVAHARDVAIGMIADGVAEVRDGLVAGEIVASDGAQELADGTHVTIESAGT